MCFKDFCRLNFIKDFHLSFTSGEISCNIYSDLMAELRPFRFVGPAGLLGFANLDLPSA